MNKPKLSVIMPSFNKADYLIEMVESIMIQTFKDWELIIVDDGSSEEQYEQIHRFISNDDRIIHIKRDRLPKNGDTCRNIGMDLAKGEYLIIFDADDIVAPNCFERRVSYMDANPQCDYATFPYASFEEGCPIPSTSDVNTIGSENSTILIELLSSHYPFTVWANIYRKKALANIRWDEKVYVYQDFDFMVQCEIEGLKHSYVDDKHSDYFYRHFTRGNSVCNNFSTEKLVSSNYLFEKVLKSLAKRQDKNVLLTSFFKFIVLHYERVILSNCKDCLERYLYIIEQYYPDKIKKFKNISIYRKMYKRNHLGQAFLHYQLYKSFGEKQNRVLAIHEFGKWILRRD